MISNKQKPKQIPLISNFCNKQKTIICGSTWPEDEKIIIKYIKENSEYKYIIAPHEMGLVSRLKKQTEGILYSELRKNKSKKSNVLIIDEIGILSSIYKYGHIAYIGGGFGKGIHNILEAVVFGLPVIFGPNYKKFNEANELIKLKTAISIKNLGELKNAIDSFTEYNEEVAEKYIKENTGSVKKVISRI